MPMELKIILTVLIGVFVVVEFIAFYISFPDSWYWLISPIIKLKRKILTMRNLSYPTFERIDSETNAEVRQKMIKIYGQEKFLFDVGAKVVHSDDWGTLYRCPLLDDKENEPFLMMLKVVNSTPEKDGSYKDYFLRVPPTMKTAHQAVAWTFGKEEDEYAPLVET